MNEREQRQATSYTATMRSRDAKWAQSPRYSQTALLEAHLRRITEICGECPIVEVQTLRRLQTLIETRATEISEEMRANGNTRRSENV